MVHIRYLSCQYLFLISSLFGASGRMCFEIVSFSGHPLIFFKIINKCYEDGKGTSLSAGHAYYIKIS